MRIGIIGAGAIGGCLGVRLARAGHAVSVLARGATLEALRSRGWRLDDGGRSHLVHPRCSDRAEALGPQELLIVTVKATALAQVAPAMAAMCGPDTAVVPAINGLPWWIFLAGAGPLAGRRLRAVDPRGAIEAAVPLARVVGCVVYVAGSTPAPAHAELAAGSNALVFGEPAGSASGRVNRIAALFTQAGFDARVSTDVRREVWIKLLGNACFNPVSLITRAHLDTLIDAPEVHALFVGMMREAIAVGRAAGIDATLDPVQRIAHTRQVGHVRTSMHQDAVAGRPVELDAILGALIEVADALAQPLPLLRAVHALATAHAREAGLLPGAS